MTITNMTITINGGRSVTGGAAISEDFSQFIGFGDSTSDTGYFFTHQISGNVAVQNLYAQALAAGGGLPTDPRYQMNTTLIAEALGLTAIATGQNGGTNYAASGATVTGTGVNPFAPSVVQQIASYLASTNNVADSQALFYVTGGGNSIRVAQSSFSNVADQAAYMEAEAHALAGSIQNLWLAGARQIVLNNISGGGTLGQTFNATLWADLEALDISFVLADSRNLLRQVIENPGDLGITNIIRPPEGPFGPQNPYNPANGGSTLNPGQMSGWARLATEEVAPNAANTFLWADNEHLSANGQRIEARYVLNAIDNAHPDVGQILTATQLIVNVGSVAQSEMSYQWQRQTGGQAEWVNISGATSGSYTVSANDIGSQLRVMAAFNRPGESASAVSPATLTVSQASADVDGINSRYDTNGSDLFQGTSDLDVVTYVGNQSVYGVSIAPGSITITGSGTDQLINIDRIQFSDGVIAFDTSGNAGDAYRVYQAAFDRTPDKSGLSYWVNEMDHGMPLSQVALNFILSPEFTATYGNINTMSNAEFVDVVYENVLHRDPDVGGFNYWMTDLSNGYPRHFMLAAFSQSAENQANVAAAIQNGILLDLGAFI